MFTLQSSWFCEAKDGFDASKRGRSGYRQLPRNIHRAVARCLAHRIGLQCCFG